MIVKQIILGAFYAKKLLYQIIKCARTANLPQDGWDISYLKSKELQQIQTISNYFSIDILCETTLKRETTSNSNVKDLHSLKSDVEKFIENVNPTPNSESPISIHVSDESSKEILLLIKEAFENARVDPNSFFAQ